MSSKQHVWTPPPAGQGRDAICKSCGVRRSVADADPKGSACPGANRRVAVEVHWDYEPMDED